jgi:hypothetical protein
VTQSHWRVLEREGSLPTLDANILSVLYYVEILLVVAEPSLARLEMAPEDVEKVECAPENGCVAANSD